MTKTGELVLAACCVLSSTAPAVSDEERRIWVGRRDDGIASVALMDAKGKRRITLEVTASGEPSLKFLEQMGRVIQTLAPGKRP